MEPGRSKYHHGNLHDALLEAACQLVQQTGVASVGLRKVAKRVGVTPTAAYRHFANLEALLNELKQIALATLYARMVRELNQVPKGGDEAAYTLAQLRAVGYSYVDFALTEPGLFRTAFAQHGATHHETSMHHTSTDPYRLLSQLVETLTHTGRLTPEKQPYAEIALWASMHGIATLLLDGPLARLSASARKVAIDRTIAMALAGLQAP